MCGHETSPVGCITCGIVGEAPHLLQFPPPSRSTALKLLQRTLQMQHAFLACRLIHRLQRTNLLQLSQISLVFSLPRGERENMTKMP